MSLRVACGCLRCAQYWVPFRRLSDRLRPCGSSNTTKHSPVINTMTTTSDEVGSDSQETGRTLSGQGASTSKPGQFTIGDAVSIKGHGTATVVGDVVTNETDQYHGQFKVQFPGGKTYHCQPRALTRIPEVRWTALSRAASGMHVAASGNTVQALTPTAAPCPAPMPCAGLQDHKAL